MSGLRPSLAALSVAALALVSGSCAVTAGVAGAAPRGRPSPGEPSAPGLAPDPLAATGVLGPASGPPIRLLGSELRDDGLELHAAIPSSDLEGAQQRAAVVFAWAMPALHQRRIHALRVVIHASDRDSAGPVVVRFGLDATRGWRRRVEPPRATDVRAGPFAPAALDVTDQLDARAVAEGWLSLVDASAYDDALAAAPQLETRGSRSAWVDFLRAVPALQGPRRGLFAFHADRLRELTGGPFVILTFVAETAGGGLLETIALERSAEGWRVVSYDAYEAGWTELAFAAIS